MLPQLVTVGYKKVTAILSVEKNLRTPSFSYWVIHFLLEVLTSFLMCQVYCAPGKHQYSSYKVLLFSQNAINQVGYQLEYGVAWSAEGTKVGLIIQSSPRAVICNRILDFYEIFICRLLFLICVLEMNYCLLNLES